MSDKPESHTEQEEEERRKAKEKEEEEKRAAQGRDQGDRKTESGDTPEKREPEGSRRIEELRDAHHRYDLGDFLKTPTEDPRTDGAVLGAGGKLFPADTPADKVPPLEPSAGKERTGVRVLYVNGIVTDVAGQEKSMQHLADQTGADVVGIHNATQGFVKDLEQCAEDKIDKVHNKAVDKLARTVEQMVEKGETVNILAHSQGALDTSRALKHVVRDWREQGIPEKEIEKRLHDHVYVETIGGAAHTFPGGPNYRHIVNKADFVPEMFGVNEVFKTKDTQFFTKDTRDAFKNHDFETYLPYVSSNFFHK